jgi:hypothetical protein
VVGVADEPWPETRAVHPPSRTATAAKAAIALLLSGGRDCLAGTPERYLRCSCGDLRRSVRE